MSNVQAAGRPESLRSLVGAVILLFIVLLALAGLKGHRDLTLARARELQLTTGIEETQANIDRLRGRIERLKTDPATLERMAREQLGMVRPNDVVIELPPGGVLVPAAALPQLRVSTPPLPARRPTPATGAAAAPSAPSPTPLRPAVFVGPQLPARSSPLVPPHRR